MKNYISAISDLILDKKNRYVYNHLQDKQIIYGHDVPLDIAESYVFKHALPRLERQIESSWRGLKMYYNEDRIQFADYNFKLKIDKEIFPLNPDVITVNVINESDNTIIDIMHIDWYIKGKGVRFDERGNIKILKDAGIFEWDKAMTRLLQLHGKDGPYLSVIIDLSTEDLIRLYSKKLRNHDTLVNNIKRELETLPDIKTNILFLNNNESFKKDQASIIKRCFFTEDIGIKEFNINNGDVVFEKL